MAAQHLGEALEATTAVINLGVSLTALATNLVVLGAVLLISQQLMQKLSSTPVEKFSKIKGALRWAKSLI